MATSALNAQSKTVQVTALDGTVHTVPVDHYAKDVRIDPSWKLGDDKVLAGHVAGYYANHKDPKVQELAYQYRCDLKSDTNRGYQSLRLQSGNQLWSAAEAWAKDKKLPTPQEVRKATKTAVKEAAAKEAAKAPAKSAAKKVA